MVSAFATAAEPFASTHSVVVPETFIDRRGSSSSRASSGSERRQFTNSHQELSTEARDLAVAIDSYKLMHRRRFITFEEMLHVVKSLGYAKCS